MARATKENPDFPPQHSLRILIVEDEHIIADDLASQVRELGHRVVGPARTLERGLNFAERHDIHFALLDIWMGRAQSFPIARQLVKRSIPFVFVTGFDERDVEPTLGHVKVLLKPLTVAMLREALVESGVGL